MLWTDHVTHLIKNISKSVFQLSQIKKILNESSRKAFFFGHIQSHLEYCSPIWGKCAMSRSKRLCSLQKRAVKLILHQNIKHSENIFQDLHIMPFHIRVIYKTCLLMHRIFNDIAPQYLQCLFNFQCVHGSTRAILPPAKSDLFKTSFSFNGCVQWNSLPKYLRQIPSFSLFKKRLRAFLFDY